MLKHNETASVAELMNISGIRYDNPQDSAGIGKGSEIDPVSRRGNTGSGPSLQYTAESLRLLSF